MLAIDRYPGQVIVIDDVLFITIIEFTKDEVQIGFACDKKDSIWIGTEKPVNEAVIKVDDCFLLTKHIDFGINYLMFSGLREWNVKTENGDRKKIVQARMGFNCEKKYTIWRKDIWDEIQADKRTASRYKPLTIGV